MTESHRMNQVRRVLDSWPFWVGVAYFGLVISFILMYMMFTKNAEDTAISEARLRTENTARVINCYTGVDRTKQIVEVLEAIEPVLLTAEARMTMRNLIDSFRLDAPSHATCRTLAKSLDVDPVPYERNLEGG